MTPDQFNAHVPSVAGMSLKERSVDMFFEAALAVPRAERHDILNNNTSNLQNIQAPGIAIQALDA